jgi:hypothetical protein
MQIAVPVSWHPGKTMLAAMFAFLSNSKATNLSFEEASGSLSILDKDLKRKKSRKINNNK